MISSAFAGIQISKRYSQRAVLLEKIRHMLEQMSINISFRAMTVYDLIVSLNENEIFKELDFLEDVKINMDMHADFYSSWRNAVEDWNVKLKEEDKKLLTEIGTTLGKNDIDGELANIAVYKERISLLLEQARNDAKTKGRMTRSLGILAGAFISVILI